MAHAHRSVRSTGLLQKVLLYYEHRQLTLYVTFHTGTITTTYYESQKKNHVFFTPLLSFPVGRPCCIMRFRTIFTAAGGNGVVWRPVRGVGKAVVSAPLL